MKAVLHTNNETSIEVWKAAILTAALLLGIVGLMSCTSATATDTPGPHGGDVVPLGSSGTKAEVLANSDTGEVMVHTWDPDLEKPQPVESSALTLGSGDESVSLEPHPMPNDPNGRCSRFYGQAEWLRGGKMRHGWLRQGTVEKDEHHFDWKHCWSGGRKSHGMWSGMSERHKGMGHRRSGHGSGTR